MKGYIEDKKANSILLLALISIMSINAAAFNSLGYNSGRIFAVLIVAISLFLNIEQTYYLAIFCFPFSGILKISSLSTTVIPVIYLVIIFKLLIKNNQKLKITPLIAFLMFVVLQFFSLIFFANSLFGIISMLLSCFFVLYSVSYFSTEGNLNRDMLKNAAIFLAVAVALNIILCDLFSNISYIVSANKQEALVEGNRYGALFVEPNEFSQAVLVAIGFLFATFSSYKTVFGKIVAVALAVYLGVNGVRSNSKSYVLALLGLLGILVILYMITFIQKKKTPADLLLFLLIVFLSIVAGFFLITKVIIPVFELRSEKSDFLTGRGDIWKEYIDALFQRIDVFLIGCGAGNVRGVLKLVHIDASHVPHNFYLEYIIQFGIFGLIFLFMSWSEAFRMMRRKSIWFWIPALAFLITAFGISSNSNDCIFITVLLLTMPIENYSKKSIESV